MRILTLVIPALLAARLLVAQGASNPEVYVMPLEVSGASVRVGKPVNITNRPGYDNQPSFTLDGRAVLYTSVRDDAQADIYRYTIASRTTQRLTRTNPESEYSAVQLPGQGEVSVIRVERDSTQRLWRLERSGADGRPVFTDIKPVGYFAWLDSHWLAMFVLGSPNALVLADTRTGRADTLARDIGRSLVALPAGGGFSFLDRHGSDWVLTRVRLTPAFAVAYIQPLVAVPPGMDYIAWIGGRAVGGAGSKLLVWEPGGRWTEIADLSADGITRISRIAVSRDSRQLAIVAEPAGGR